MLIIQSSKKRLILTPLFTFLMWFVSIAQKPGNSNMGVAIKEFINSPKVIDNFRKSNTQEDSALIIVDLNNVVNGYPISSWKGFKVILLNRGPLVDSLKKLDAHYLLKNRCNYYVLMSRKQGAAITVIALRHACSNVVSEVKIVEKKRLFYLGKIENEVW